MSRSRLSAARIHLVNRAPSARFVRVAALSLERRAFIFYFVNRAPAARFVHVAALSLERRAHLFVNLAPSARFVRVASLSLWRRSNECRLEISSHVVQIKHAKSVLEPRAWKIVLM